MKKWLTGGFQVLVEVVLGPEGELSGNLDHLEVVAVRDPKKFFAGELIRNDALTLVPSSFYTHLHLCLQ